MDTRRFLDLLPRVISGEWDRRYTNVLLSMYTMSGCRHLAVLNAAVSCMTDTETYLEIGTHKGGSLISALMENDKYAVAVDNFSQFTSPENPCTLQHLQANLEKYQMLQRVSVFEVDYQEYFKTHHNPDLNIGVYYYDGIHDELNQLIGMELGYKRMRKDTLIIVDDISYPWVTHSINEFISIHSKEVRVVFMKQTQPEGGDSLWWNGICVLQVI